MVATKSLSLGSAIPQSSTPISGSSSQAPSSDSKIDLPWVAKFKASLHNLKQMSQPTYLEDGTPVVIAPSSVLLKSAALWKGHVVAQFHGSCPPATRIFSDLNPIWGNYGDITVRIVSETVALIFIPALNTRQWVVDVGFWQAGNCSCTVYPWSSEGLLNIDELKTAPTWAVLKNVPPQLYSLEGISVIASAIGVPLHTEKSRLDPINIGSTKVKVVIKLDLPLPSSVVVKDVQGNSARVDVEYPRPPPKCLNCGKYGHLLSRCLIPLQKKLPFKKDSPSGAKEVALPPIFFRQLEVVTQLEVSTFLLLLQLRYLCRNQKGGALDQKSDPLALLHGLLTLYYLSLPSLLFHRRLWLVKGGLQNQERSHLISRLE